MADMGKPKKPGYAASSASVFWASPAMSSSKQETIVPGVNSAGNMRPRVKGGKTKEVRAYVPIKQPVVETTDSHGNKTSVGMMSDISTIETDISNLRNKQVSLRDLCVEDKKRVANLIKELARVVDEKDNAEQNLASERDHYQEQILKLVEQQETILKEREDVQSKLLDYQNLIVKLQQEHQLHHLRQQQEKQRKLQHRSPGKETRMEIKHMSPKGTKDEKNSQSQRKISSHGHRRITEEVNPKPLSNPDPGIKEDEDSDEDDDRSEEGDESEMPVELPSQNLYMNVLDESDVEEFSTQALPGLSPPSQEVRSKSMSYRPFTAMIDQELVRQQAALTAAGFVSEDRDIRQRKEHTRKGNTDFSRYNGEAPPSIKPKSSSAQLLEKPSSKGRSPSGNDEEERELNYNKMSEGVLDTNFILPSQTLVSPEKAAIFSRFMDSQSHNFHDREQVGEEKTGRETRKDRMEKASDLKERKKQKKKKRPPAVFGGFHPPIMSSTQKSSEFGDYVDSSINSERKLVAANEQQPEAVENVCDEDSEDGSVNVDGKRPERRRHDENSDDECGGHDRKTGKSSSDKMTKSSKRKGKAKVEFSDMAFVGTDCQFDAPDGDRHLDVDPDYLSYYKKLSGSERKRELLKQRSSLLEEQNKLKNILEKQDHRLMVRQAEAAAKMETMQGFSEEDRLARRKMQDSLEEMEIRLAVKEEAVKRERELLQQRRKNQLDRHISDVPSIESDIRQEQEGGGHQQTCKPQSERLATAGISSTRKSFQQKDVVLGQRDGLREGNAKEPKAVVNAKDSKAKQSASRNERKDRHSLTKVSSCADRDDGKNDEDSLARRLEYSFHSDAGLPDTDKTEEVEPKTTAKDGTVSDRLGKANTDKPVHDASNSPPHTKVDAGTSISFATLDRDSTDLQEQRAQPVNVNVRRSAEKFSRKKHLSESPGEKTLAVIEIINSLDDLDAFGTSSSNPTQLNPRVKEGQTGNSRKISPLKSQLTKTFPSNGKQNAIEKHPALSSISAQHGRPLSHFHPDRHLQTRSTLGFQRLTALESRQPTRSDDTELDLFHLPQFKEERLDGFRRLANRVTDDDDDSDDIVYEYDDNDDSNIDDIVNALSESLVGGAEEYEGCEFDGEEDDVWDAMVNDLNNISSLKLQVQDSLDADTSSLGDFDKLSLSSDRKKREYYADDSDILEEVFFINP